MLSICKLFEKFLKSNFFTKFFFFHFQLRTAARVTATKVQPRRPREICDSSRQLLGIEEFSREREEITLQSLTNWNRLAHFFQAKNHSMVHIMCLLLKLNQLVNETSFECQIQYWLYNTWFSLFIRWPFKVINLLTPWNYYLLTWRTFVVKWLTKVLYLND